MRETNETDLTTVNYEQRYERIEMTTVQPTSAELSPAGMFKQESSRFDNGLKLEDEETTNHEALESATIVNLDGVKEIATTDRNSSTVYSNLESTKYETQTEDELKSEVSTNQSTSVGTGQKRGKYLQTPEEATIINSETNEPNLSIPSTADVWALAAMKNVDHSKRRIGFNTNDTATDRNSEVNAANGTSATKLLTDWMEIMKNNEFPNGSFLANDIPSVVERPQQSREENKLIEVTVTPPPHMQQTQSTTSARRFDESIDTTTEFDFYRPTGSEAFPSGLGRVSDNLYYEDFTTDLPDFLTTTATESEQINLLPTVMTATTESGPRNDINTVPNEVSFDRKPTEALNDIVASLESTSLKENYVLTTTPTTTTTTSTKEAQNLNSGFSQSPTMPVEEVTETTEETPRIIPLVDAAFTTEKKELEQLPTPPPKQEQEQGREEEQQILQVVQSTLSPTDITNNSIERHTETKVVESNNFPEYTVVGPTSTGSGNGVGEDDSTSIHNNNNNHSNSNGNNYLETASNPNSPSKEGGLPHEAIYFTRTDYPMTESSGAVSVSVVGLSTTAAAGHSNNEDQHEAVAFEESGASEQSAGGAASETMTTTSHFQTTISSSSSSAAAAAASPDQTTASETMTSTKATTMAPERIEVETLRTNGHQMVNNSVDLASIGATLGAAAEETTPTEGKDVNGIIAIVVSVIAVIALVLLVGFLYVMRKRQKQLSYGQRCQPVGLDAYSLDNVSVYNSVRRKNNNLRLSKRSYGNSAFEDPVSVRN